MTNDEIKNKFLFIEDENLDPCVRVALVEINLGKEVHEKNPSDARKDFIDYQNKNSYIFDNPNFNSITSQYMNVELRDGSTCDVYHLAGSSESAGTIFFIHGGGWVIGSFADHKQMMYNLVNKTGYDVIFVDYALAPKNVYPEQIIQIEEIFKTIFIDHEINEINGNINKENIVIAGNSAGANMAFVLLKHLESLCEEDSIVYYELRTKIRAVHLLWPCTAVPNMYESWNEFSTGRYLTAKDMVYFWESYLGVEREKMGGKYDDDRFILYSDFNRFKKRNEYFPNIYIHVAENDILRDEGEVLGKKLSNSGFRCTTIRYNGVTHDFGLLNSYSKCPQYAALFYNIKGSLYSYKVKDNEPN